MGNSILCWTNKRGERFIPRGLCLGGAWSTSHLVFKSSRLHSPSCVHNFNISTKTSSWQREDYILVIFDDVALSFWYIYAFCFIFSIQGDTLGCAKLPVFWPDWAWPGLAKPKQSFCFEVKWRFCTTWCVTLYISWWMRQLSQGKALVISGRPVVIIK